MSLFDSLLGQLGGNLDVAAIASQVGIDPAIAQQAIDALGAAHNQEGDTVDTAAAQTGIDPGTLSQITGLLGGHEGLGQVAQLVESKPQLVSSLLGAITGGEGGGLMGLAQGLFKKS